jgi:hypothetical protein
MAYLIDTIYVMRELSLLLYTVITCPLTLAAALLLVDFSAVSALFTHQQY